MKKIICSILIVAMFLSLTSTAFASDTQISELKETVSQNAIKQVSEMVPVLCENLSSTCYLGEALRAYLLTKEGTIEPKEYDVYPVLSGGNIVALAQVAEIDGTENVSCITGYAAELQAYYAQNQNAKIAIIYAHDGIYLLTENQLPTKIYSAEQATLGEIGDVARRSYQVDVGKITAKIPFSPRTQNSRAIQSVILDVVPVANDNVTCSREPSCNSVGLCWAACMAMITNYYRGTSYNTNTVHAARGCMSYEKTANDYKQALILFGMYVNGPYYSFTYSDAVTLAENNRLGFMRIYRIYSENGITRNDGHMIVPCGYYYNPDSSSTKYFCFKDPNHNGTGMQAIPASGLLSVTTSGRVYQFDYYLDCSWF